MSVDSAAERDRGVRAVLSELDGWPVDSVSAAVVAGDQTWTHGDVNRPYALASVSKLITAYAVLMAVEEGALELEDTIDPDLVPAFASPPTVRQLLDHSAGMGFLDRAQLKPPGQRRVYSSAAYDLLGEVVERATGIQFGEYIREGICLPLGLHADVSGGAGHGFAASVSDLQRLSREFLAPTLLARETVERAMRSSEGRAEGATAELSGGNTADHTRTGETRRSEGLRQPSGEAAGLSGVVPGYGRHSPCPWGLGFEIHGDKRPHWMGPEMPPNCVGHFGQSGTFLWLHPETSRAAVVLTDRMFGDWSKDLWPEFNDRLWQALSSAS